MEKELKNRVASGTGSLAESHLETHLIISKNLNYINSRTLEVILQKTQEINKMLNALINSLSKTR
ncbi:MAG TPA: four helix bundle protein [Candidatus Brocadiia bacterium]